ncbi:SH3-containing GRB2-like protein 3-interacting protein 1 [Bagarius yarrelli]|uniref:SH3-containing GRB2-like protein 3-interacting protein 1 n=1 Tax=Bagarius yarrelli TaxID=175774 RepID=A0A556VYL5_BAGYA|nr:SH3-containing GRB2-like protein 3-interacting protein 1 [Bagarius yarrelli]
MGLGGSVSEVLNYTYLQFALRASQKKSNGAPNGFYGEIDWDRYNSPMVDDEGYSIRPDEDGDILTCACVILHKKLFN